MNRLSSTRPHCGIELPPVSDVFCPDCRGDLPDSVWAASSESSTPPPIPTDHSPFNASNENNRSTQTTWGQSLLIAFFLGVSIEFANHESIGATIGNVYGILAFSLGVVVVHAIRVFLCSGDRNLGCLMGALIILPMAMYHHYDAKYFAAHRPWNLFLFVLFILGIVVVLIGFVMALIRMFEMESERAMGKACLGLALTGFGPILALIWGWRLLVRENTPLPANQCERHAKHMTIWTAGLVVQVVVLGYVWLHSTALNNTLLAVISEPPVHVHSEFDCRNDQGIFYRVRITNTSTEVIPQIRWSQFPGEKHRVNQSDRRSVRRTLIGPIPPGGTFELPHLYDAGWIFEFDCGSLGVKVYELKGFFIPQQP